MTGTHASAAARVLIVEDDAVFRGPLRATLAAEGYTVVAVASAEAAESVLDHEAVDVVLSDLGLPGMDGAALAARHPRIPFVLMTGLPPDPASNAALPRSVMARLVKPFDVPHLCAVLREAVEAAGATRRRSGRDRPRAVNSHPQRGGSGANASI
jgi:two-component system, NtrC family, response regulator AtoC